MENFYARFARVFVTNKQLSLLLILVSFAAGILGFYATPKQYNPEITLPAFRITTDFPGATSTEVERLVTSEIENKLMEIPGVDELMSQSFAGGRSVVSVMFKIGADLDKAKTEVFEKMAGNLELAPLGVGAPLIQQINPENVPVLTLALSSQTYSAEGLREFAYDLREQLKTVPGVTNLEVKGGRARELNIFLDPGKMSARGVAVTDIVNAIKANNLRVPVGELQSTETFIPVEVDGNLVNRNQLAALTVGGLGAEVVHLEDVAQVEDSFETIENHVRFAEKANSETASPTPATAETTSNTVFLSLAKLKGANVSDVTAAALAKVEALKNNFIPDGITLTVTHDEGTTAREEVQMLTEHLFFAIAIVTITLIFFLGWRAALVVATAIPLTLALVFFVGFIFHQTINRITLFALIFSLGLLVDDAIVVVENIYRHFNKGQESKTEAVIRATGEVGMGVLLSTVTAVIVFLPMGFVTGMMGAYMGPIAFFAPVARLASLFVAYSFSPYLSLIYLEEKGAQHEQHSTKLDVWYRKLIQKILGNRQLQNKILGGVILATLLAFTFPVFEFIHFRMLPKADREQFYIYLDAPEGTSLAQMDAFAARAEKLSLQNPDVISVETFVGTSQVLDFNGLFRGADARVFPYQATLKVDLKNPKERALKSETIVAALRPQVLELFRDELDLKVKLVEDPPGPPVLATLLARVKGPDERVRESIARDLLAMYRATPGIVDLDTSLPSGATEKLIRLDHAKLASSGLSAAEVIQSLTAAISGSKISIAHLDTRERNYVYVRFAADARSTPAKLDQIFFRNHLNQMVALGSVSEIVDTATASPIWHDKREAMTLVSGEMSGRAVTYAVKDLIFKLLDYQGPATTQAATPTENTKLKLTGWNLFGLNYRDQTTGDNYRIEWGGEFEMTLKNFRDLGIAMLISFFLIYITLVAQFRSFRSPALIMTAIPLAFAGILVGFAVLDRFGIYFSATSMIGVIALGGIVVGNAILLLDFMEQLRERGFTPEMAIIDACQTRLRPILLTALTAVLGSLVIVADPVWSGLAWAIAIGLTISTALTLVIFPILYLRFGSATAEK